MTDQLERIKKMPGVTAAIRAAPHMNWPESGLMIWADENLNINCWWDPEDIRKARFQNMYETLHPWSSWVKLAKRILEVDAALTSGQPGGE